MRKNLGYDPSAKKNVGGMAVVTGKIELYKNKLHQTPQLVITHPSPLQIFIDEEVPASQVPPIQKKN